MSINEDGAVVNRTLKNLAFNVWEATQIKTTQPLPVLTIS